MQGWSWMAALTLVASMAGALAPTSRAAEPPPVKQKVSLNLRLDGVSAAGGEVEIKPGHAGCRFDTLKIQTKTYPRKSSDGTLLLDPIEVETVSADRDCSFTITLKEPGQPDKIVRRTIRIVPPVEGKPAKPQEMTFYLSSNSLKPAVDKTAQPKQTATKPKAADEKETTKKK
jgi:hypothetical protein